MTKDFLPYKLCGSITDNTLLPKTSYWYVAMHAQMAMNITFTYFQLPVFTKFCDETYVQLLHGEEELTFCGKRHPWEEFTSASFEVVFVNENSFVANMVLIYVIKLLIK